MKKHTRVSRSLAIMVAGQCLNYLYLAAPMTPAGATEAASARISDTLNRATAPAAAKPMASAPAAARSASTSSSASTAQSPFQQEKIPCIRWVDETVTPTAVLFCIHGLGLHKGTYEDFGRTMAKRGLITYAIDVRGFGEWLGKGKRETLDFDSTLSDIKRALTEIRKLHPGLPVIVVGESMGGAIGIHTVALFPDLTDGLVSSVPSGDRFGSVDSGLKVGMHAIFGGFDKKINVGDMVISKATKKDDLRDRWSNDSLARKDFSPAELMAFQNFMNKNFDMAGMIKDKPVLIIAGTDDKLVRPAANNKLFDSLSTPHKICVFSAAAEHLIFEENQFKPQDIEFVTKWLNKKVIAKGAETETESDKVASANNAGGTGSNTNATSTKTEDPVALAPAVKVKPDAAQLQKNAAREAETIKVGSDSQAVSYWIELLREGKIYRCNNKIAFKSGDAIRFHVIPQVDGYGYIMLKQGSSGKKAILFPPPNSKINNFLNANNDYPLPYDNWLSFDATPGVEKVSLVFSRVKLAASQLTPPESMTAFVSNDRSGAKDLVPTRMQLSWDDPTPVILPGDVPGGNMQVAQTNTGSLVKVSFNDPGGMVAIDVALAHQ